MKQAVQVSEFVLFDKRLSDSVLRVIAYFDVFSYPLTRKEIFEYCDIPNVNLMAFEHAIAQLETNKLIYKLDQFYCLGDVSCIAQRIAANNYSDYLLEKSRKYIRLIAAFPFVRGVFISGSLSKRNAGPDADVDYFIITAENRLWICRTLLVLFKKIFLFNSRKFFCINYFVDTNNLEIVDKNRYTATEIAFLMPVYSEENYLRFMAANTWVSRYYPGKRIEFNADKKHNENHIVKRFLEKMLDNAFGMYMDDILQQITVKYRRLKFKNMEDDAFDQNLRATKGVSKHHPNSFQNKVLKKYHETLSDLKYRSLNGF